jgi:hypothetical protein
VNSRPQRLAAARSLAVAPTVASASTVHPTAIGYAVVELADDRRDG